MKYTVDRRIQYLVLLLLAFVLVAAGSYTAYRMATGQGIGLRSSVKAAGDFFQAILASPSVKQYSKGEYTNIVFLHHSVGHLLIEQSSVRELLRERGYQFWDQGYNISGLRGPDGQYTGYAYTVPADNTDPDGLAVIFGQTPRSLPVNALSGLLQHEVIVFKSCFPVANIVSAEDLEGLKKLYFQMRATIDQHPNKIFILLTTPPLNPAETNRENAQRAREMANWLRSEAFVEGRTNLYVFDLFDVLAEPDGAAGDANMLKAVYRNGVDSHPNQAGNQYLAPVLTEYIHGAIEDYKND